MFNVMVPFFRKGDPDHVMGTEHADGKRSTLISGRNKSTSFAIGIFMHMLPENNDTDSDGHA